MVKTRIRNHKRVFTRFAVRRPQTPAEASLEASLNNSADGGHGKDDKTLSCESLTIGRGAALQTAYS